MENPFGKPKNPEKPKPRPEKSQAELRRALTARFSYLEKTTKQKLSEYEVALGDGTFEDKEGEEAGSGEKRKDTLQAGINASLDRAEQMKAMLDGKEELPQHTTEIQVTHNTESITLNIEKKTQEFLAFYQTHTIDTPPDFEDQIKEIWANNVDAIQKAIEENGFDDMLLMPPNMALPDLHAKMTEGYTVTYEGAHFTQGGSFRDAKSQNVDKPRIVLVHRTQNLKDRPELKKTLNIQGKDVKLNEVLTLEDYLVFQRKYFKETDKHLDEVGWTWLATKSGSRLVRVSWAPGEARVIVGAFDPDSQFDSLGARPTRSFF